MALHTLGIYGSLRFLVLYFEIWDLSVNLWRRFSGQTSFNILHVMTHWSEEKKDFTVSLIETGRNKPNKRNIRHYNCVERKQLTPEKNRNIAVTRDKTVKSF